MGSCFSSNSNDQTVEEDSQVIENLKILDKRYFGILIAVVVFFMEDIIWFNQDPEFKSNPPTL